MKSTKETNIVISMSNEEAVALCREIKVLKDCCIHASQIEKEIPKINELLAELLDIDVPEQKQTFTNPKQYAELRFDYVSETGERTYRILTVTSIKKNHFRPVNITRLYNPIERITGFEERVKGFRTFKWERMTNVLLLRVEKNSLRSSHSIGSWSKTSIDFNRDPMVLPALIQSINPEVKIEY